MNLVALGDLLPAASREYEKADRLYRLGFVTEAGLRLGRTVEAALYSISRDLDVSLSEKVIEDIEVIRKTLQDKGIGIMRKAQDASEVRRLAEVSKSLSEAIAFLIGDGKRREGVPLAEPRRVDGLVRELIQLAPNEDTKAKLKRQQSVLRSIRDARNKAAHADPLGQSRELGPAEYDELLASVAEFLNVLVYIAIGVRGSKCGHPGAAV
jgi:hypothetical protein